MDLSTFTVDAGVLRTEAAVQGRQTQLAEAARRLLQSESVSVTGSAGPSCKRTALSHRILLQR
jgi:hypothetical protein